MRITLKLFATLSENLPAGASANAVEVEVPSGATVAQVIAQFDVPEEMAHLVLVNGVYVPPPARAAQTLGANDSLAIWPPVAGG